MKKARARPKTKTFSGCWTCRARKIKCDLGRPNCGCCLKSRVPCRGYKIRLHWVHCDDAVSPSVVRRQAMVIALGDPHWPTGSLGDIDEHLQDVELHATFESQQPFTAGPFGVFYKQCEPDAPLRHVPMFNSTLLRSSTLGDEVPSRDKAVEELSELPEQSRRVTPKADVVETTMTEQRVSLTSAAQATSLKWWTKSWPAPDSPGIANTSQHDMLVDTLMKHYTQEVTNILQPVLHAQNAYSSIYASEAMSIARRNSWKDVFQHMRISNSKLALLCSLLTSSSFHLRCSAHTDDADATARYFRIKAMHYLRLALSSRCLQDSSSTVSAPWISNAETVLSVMLTLVTADVLDGGMNELWIHLDAAQSFVTRLKDRAPSGSPVEHLINVYSFLRILSDSTSIHTLVSPWSPSAVEPTTFLGGAHSLEFTYGITARLADLLRRSCRLAQNKTYYRMSNCPPPAGFLSACDDLFEDLSSWNIRQESLLSFSTTDDTTTLLGSKHILAFATAIRIYFHARVSPCDEGRMQSLVQDVAVHLTELEAIKRQTGYDATPTATISWPGFIASCQANMLNRDIWTDWWDGMHKYHIGNIPILWSVVQDSWTWQDRGARDDAPWTFVLHRRERRILAI